MGDVCCRFAWLCSHVDNTDPRPLQLAELAQDNAVPVSELLAKYPGYADDAAKGDGSRGAKRKHESDDEEQEEEEVSLRDVVCMPAVLRAD